MYLYSYLIGIDESGRGPLAGPVVLAAVCVEKGNMRRFARRFRGIYDPKRMTAKRREEWFLVLKKAEGNGVLRVSISSSSNTVIDKHGIMPAVRFALGRAARRVVLLTPSKTEGRDTSRVLLDGGLRAQRTFVNQETIIKGDTKEPLIMVAALAAKVTRDRAMMRYAARYPQYEFHRHKGYATKAHYAALQKHGPCKIHRHSFLQKFRLTNPHKPPQNTLTLSRV